MVNFVKIWSIICNQFFLLIRLHNIKLWMYMVGLAILSIESEVLELLDYKILINDFAAKKAKKLI